MHFLLADPAIGHAAKEKWHHIRIACTLFLFPLELWFRPMNWRNSNRSCNLHHELDHPQSAPVFGMQKLDTESHPKVS